VNASAITTHIDMYEKGTCAKFCSCFTTVIKTSFLKNCTCKKDIESVVAAATEDVPSFSK